MAITKATASSVAPAAKGDLVVGSATNDAAVLAVGTNDHVLTADSSTATGLKWAAASSGGMTLIQETVASAVSSLSFSSIPSTYKHLYLTWQGIQHSTSATNFNIRFNNDSGTKYVYRFNYSENAGFIETSSNDATQLVNSGSQAPFGRDCTGTDEIQRAMGFLFIENYASTSKNKMVTGAWSFNWIGTASVKVFQYLGFFNDTAAISSIDIYRGSGTGTFTNQADTSIRLYGVS